MAKSSRELAATSPPKLRAGWDWFWYYAAERQQIYWRRLKGQPPPWTDDPILSAYRFTNVYRAADRVSQFLINRVQAGNWDWPDTFLRTLLFKLFNQPQTWQRLVDRLGEPDCKNLKDLKLDQVLDQIASQGPIYNPAYIMPRPANTTAANTSATYN